MDAYKTHGAFSWSELTTTDPGAATQFYASLFGWKVEPMNMPQGKYHVVKAGDTSVGGIMKMPADAPQMPPSWCPYVTVEDVDQTAQQCTALAGKVLMPPTDVPGVGRMAVLQDPQGACLNVITYVQG